MPLYEYKCLSCGETFEVLQKFSDKTLEVHEKCGGAVQRLISPSAFHFKGTGWYVTDYKKKSNGKSLPETKSAPANGKTDGKTGGKPETTANKSESSAKPAESPKTA